MGRVIQQYKITGSRGFFDDELNCDLLLEIGNSLKRILELIDFELFRYYWTNQPDIIAIPIRTSNEIEYFNDKIDKND